MLNLQVSQSDWLLAKKYWVDLKKHLNHPDDSKKFSFVNRVIFESSGLNNVHNSQSLSTTGSLTTTTTTLVADEKDATNIPSITTMSEIINEIDNELEKTDKKVDESQTSIKIDPKIKAFICEPV